MRISAADACFRPTEESCGQFCLEYYFLRGKLRVSWSGLLSMKRIIDWSDRLTISFCLVCATNSDGAAVVRHDGGRSCLVRFSRIGIDFELVPSRSHGQLHRRPTWRPMCVTEAPRNLYVDGVDRRTHMQLMPNN